MVDLQNKYECNSHSKSNVKINMTIICAQVLTVAPISD